MPRQLVTREQVFAAADTLIEAGQIPTLITVQKDIGGGSYTTIKRYLDEWNTQRKVLAQQIPVVPDPLIAQGNEFVRLLWSTALTYDDERLAQVRAEAQRQIDTVNAKLTEAEDLNAKLDEEIDQMHQHLEAEHAIVDDLRNKLGQAITAAETAEARAELLSRQVTELRAELELVRQQHDGRIAESIALIQQQLQQLTQRPRLDEQNEVGSNESVKRAV